MLEKIVEKEDAVKALIELGSRAGRQAVDHFSDYDLSVFCNADESYTESESWLSQFGHVWNTMELFKRITAETAQSLQLSSMEELSENMMGFLTTLKSSPL